MTEQKLRKFKLIDREGFLNKHGDNVDILKEVMVDGILQGVEDEFGNIGNNPCYGKSFTYIFKSELKFFEEVFDKGVTFERAEWNGDGVPPKGTICNLTSLKYEGRVLIKGYYGGCVWVEKKEREDWEDANYVCPVADSKFEPIKPKTWQEQLCEEFRGIDIASACQSQFGLSGGMDTEEIIHFAKRIIELTEGGE